MGGEEPLCCEKVFFCCCWTGNVIEPMSQLGRSLRSEASVKGVLQAYVEKMTRKMSVFGEILSQDMPASWTRPLKRND